MVGRLVGRVDAGAGSPLVVGRCCSGFGAGFEGRIRGVVVVVVVVGDRWGWGFVGRGRFEGRGSWVGCCSCRVVGPWSVGRGCGCRVGSSRMGARRRLGEC